MLHVWGQGWLAPWLSMFSQTIDLLILLIAVAISCSPAPTLLRKLNVSAAVRAQLTCHVTWIKDPSGQSRDYLLLRNWGFPEISLPFRQIRMNYLSKGLQVLWGHLWSPRLRGKEFSEILQLCRHWHLSLAPPCTKGRPAGYLSWCFEHHHLLCLRVQDCEEQAGNSVFLKWQVVFSHCSFVCSPPEMSGRSECPVH